MKRQIRILIISIILGFFIGFLAAKFFADDPAKIEFSASLLLSCAVAILLVVLAFFLQIILHELGHLVMGLLTGYRFVSFRISHWVLIRKNKQFQVKKNFIPGTMGQCLMDPPTIEEDSVPYKAYNAGGVLFNILAAIFCLMLSVVLPVSFPLNLFLWMMILFGVWFALINGIPMKMSGIANDARNIQLLKKDPIARKAFALQLRINALLSEGVLLRDMPAEWFELPAGADLHNYFHASLKLFESGRYLDLLQFEDADRVLQELKPYLPQMIRIYKYEIECELVFLAIVLKKDRQEIDRIYTPELKTYVKQSEKYMLSKKRLLYTYALMVEEDVEKANSMLSDIINKKSRFPLQGETESELNIIETISRM